MISLARGDCIDDAGSEVFGQVQLDERFRVVCFRRVPAYCELSFHAARAHDCHAHSVLFLFNAQHVEEAWVRVRTAFRR